MIVSQFVARELSKRSFLEFIKQATIQSRSINNGSFDGWIFQMDFLFHFRKAFSESQFLQLENNETWPVTRIFDFRDEVELENKTSQFMDGCWFIPSKVNHGAYDVAQLLDNLSTLRIVQLTISKTHNLKLEYVIKLLKSLKKRNIAIQKLEVVVVVPAGFTTQFKIGQVFSDQNVSITELGWNKNQIQIKGFRRCS